jgi:hypothetical protein
MGEQLSFLPPPPLSPKIPKAGTHHWRALEALTDSPPLRPTHWLVGDPDAMHWRMSAIICELTKDGWEIDNLQPGKKQAIYVMTKRCRQLFARIRVGEQQPNE